jgi:hypothetical protein
MRRELGPSGRLIRLSWVAAALTLLLVLAQGLDQARGGDGEPFGTLVVCCAVAGWLLSFLFGVLQRILPFLGSMHAARGRRRAPTPSALTAQAPLALHEICHVAALVLLAPAVLLRSGAWLVAAAVAGGVGALALLSFFAVLLHRLARAAPPA